MFIVALTYKVDLSEVEKHIDAHIHYLEKYYDCGCFLASGRKVPRSGGVILAQAESHEALDAVIKEDPFFTEGVADYEVTEFVVSKSAAGLERLREC